MPRVDDRRVLSGIVHALKSGGHWGDCPEHVYGPKKTLYNRCRRWAERGVWERIFASLVGVEGRPRHHVMIYPENPMPGVLFGSFANRNSTGLFLVACLALLMLLPSLRPLPWFAGLRIGGILVLTIGVVLTGSRSAMVLGAVALVSGLLGWLHSREWAALRPRMLVLGTAGVAAMGLAAIAVLPGSRAGVSLDRFAQAGDARAFIWEDAAFSARRYWPVGAGMGAFDEVFQADESLENLTERRAGRAHNDYLEVAVEAGLPGLLVIAGGLALIGWHSFAARHRSQRRMAWAGSAVLLAVALQSLVDYPLRNQALLALAALALALLVRCSTGEERGQ